ncbi:SulP family inorganic anion transporter [Hymenobacter chitinivorans]|uniref:MFS superfamily sulfate permease-like transporter n=1 Tax=Hymenobacter chitinivorans DSM 11115 TaxID=1121954 RepID=A0A2M9BMG8_9BACT|nr:SulP family inorganic anion transporter [Hymenobacter chitinivorans]PJJ59136.1 MFS superfamily sulfate permease-like transporter [Hymenobacter chitinivorans DSM 11115]
MAFTKLEAPASSPTGRRRYFRADVRAGFLVFLLALPLSMALAHASGFPPVAGLLSAIVGGVVGALVGGPGLTIKGPAAGLVALAASAVQELGHGNAQLGYKLTLAVIVVAGLVQVIFGLLHLGSLGEVVPAAAVRGLLAAIGLTLIAKQLFVLTGTGAPSQLPLLTGIPRAFATLNPAVCLIGLVSLALLLGLPRLRVPGLRHLPAPLVLVLVAVGLGRGLGLGPDLLVKLPGKLTDAVTFPDFSQVLSGPSLRYIVLFALVGSLESVLSARAVDLLAPLPSRASLNRDLLTIGIGNTLAGLVGGLPLISEIVRSSANVRSGAQTRWANFYHGLLLLVLGALGAPLLTQIPQAALAALLLYTGLQLVWPGELTQLWPISGEQRAVFLVTVGVALTAGLLSGVGAGIGVKLLIHLWRGLPLRRMFWAAVDIEQATPGLYEVRVLEAAVFSNYFSLQNRLETLPTGQHIIIDLSQTRLVDHTALENLARYAQDYARSGGQLTITGLPQPVSAPPATRVRTAAPPDPAPA